MEKIIYNQWRQTAEGYFRAVILKRSIAGEGLDISRCHFEKPGEMTLSASDGHIVTVLSGEVLLKVKSYEAPLQAGPSVHIYIPPDECARFQASENTHLIHVSGPRGQSRGRRLILRDEQFLRATANGDRSFRWILTPQYLSRRIFLFHDPVLLSRNGYPVSWFHTTMFDVNGLPENSEGRSVFKMSYDNQSEVNVCFDVSPGAEVRMACHPYSDEDQKWGPWQPLDNHTTYYLNETSYGSEVEWHYHREMKTRFSRRNKHEVFVPEGGSVSLCCLFDPAPTGMERHSPGEYSAYEHIRNIIHTEAYSRYLKALAPYDKMVDELSLKKALFGSTELEKSGLWQLYRQGLDYQMHLESELIRQLREDKSGRDKVVMRWSGHPA